MKGLLSLLGMIFYGCALITMGVLYPTPTTQNEDGEDIQRHAVVDIYNYFMASIIIVSSPFPWIYFVSGKKEFIYLTFALDFCMFTFFTFELGIILAINHDILNPLIVMWASFCCLEAFLLLLLLGYGIYYLLKHCYSGFAIEYESSNIFISIYKDSCNFKNELNGSKRSAIQHG